MCRYPTRARRVSATRLAFLMRYRRDASAFYVTVPGVRRAYSWSKALRRRIVEFLDSAISIARITGTWDASGLRRTASDLHGRCARRRRSLAAVRHSCTWSGHRRDRFRRPPLVPPVAVLRALLRCTKSATCRTPAQASAEALDRCGRLTTGRQPGTRRLSSRPGRFRHLTAPSSCARRLRLRTLHRGFLSADTFLRRDGVPSTWRGCSSPAT